jgi:hypothetical protein
MLTVADMGMVDWSMKAMNKAMGDREKPEGPHEPGLVGELHAPTSCPYVAPTSRPTLTSRFGAAQTDHTVTANHRNCSHT